jgi:hypothetical protein
VTLTRDDVRTGLSDLADRLHEAGVAVSVHVVGGAAVMLTVRPDRQSTVDVDSWINAHGDEAVRARVLSEAVLVARRNTGFRDDWLNDAARMFIPDGIGGDREHWTPLIERGGVRILVATADVLLAMKLHAGRGRRDLPDLQALIDACGLRSRQEVEELFDRYYPHDEMKVASSRWLEANLA